MMRRDGNSLKLYDLVAAATIGKAGGADQRLMTCMALRVELLPNTPTCSLRLKRNTAKIAFIWKVAVSAVLPVRQPNR